MNDGPEDSAANPSPPDAVTDPLPSRETESAPALGAHEHGSASGASAGAQKPNHNSRNFLRRLTVNEWLTFLVGVGSLVVSILTYRTASDTSDIKAAIGNLANLAYQTKRQADASSAQLTFLSQQVDEAKAQTKAISEQTAAMKVTADAEQLAARAENAAADMTARAMRPAVTMEGIDITGFAAPPDKDGAVDVTVYPTFKNIGGSPLNTGKSTIILFTGDNLPPVPSYENATYFGGANELIVTTGTTFSTSQPIHYKFRPDAAKSIVAGENKVFVYGIVNYEDAASVQGHWCYAYEVVMKDGRSDIFRPSGSPAYHCSK